MASSSKPAKKQHSTEIVRISLQVKFCIILSHALWSIKPHNFHQFVTISISLSISLVDNFVHQFDGQLPSVCQYQQTWLWSVQDCARDCFQVWPFTSFLSRFLMSWLQCAPIWTGSNFGLKIISIIASVATAQWVWWGCTTAGMRW